MNVLIYVGPAPSRDSVIQFSMQIVQKVATSVTLVTGGGEARQFLLQQALDRLRPPDNLPLQLRALPGDAQSAILSAAQEQSFDLVIFGRLHQPLRRLLPGLRSKTIAQRLEPSVLRVQGLVRPIQRILLASGGDYHTFEDSKTAAQLALPLGASVTLLHVVSQQSLLFEGFRGRMRAEDFLNSSMPEAVTLREAADQLTSQAIQTRLKVRIGMVLHEIQDELTQGAYDLLVLGAHRVASALDRILLEDITGDLLDRSTLPVLVVKAEI